MQTNLQALLEEIQQLEKSLVAQLKQKQGDILYSMKNGVAVFENEVLERQCELKQSVHRFLFESSFLSLLVSPMVYAMLIPAVMLDVFAWLFQLICFPVYKIPKVVRSDYIVLDRSHLAYLNWIEQRNCDYCGYFNGLIAYVREIASRTELYFCPIRHVHMAKGLHHRHADFLPYGDASQYHERLEELREKLRAAETPQPPTP